MRRNYYTMLLVFSALLFVGFGCRRAGPGQTPVDVLVEKDDFTEFSNEDLLFKLTPKKKWKLKGEGDAIIYDFPREMFSPHVEVIWPPVESDAAKKIEAEAKDRFEKLEKKYRLEDQSAELVALAKAYKVFVAATKPYERSADNLKKHLRRAKHRAIRKQIDAGEIELVMDADVETAGHLLAYRTQTDGGDGNLSLFAPDTVDLNKKENLERKIKDQQFELIWRAHNAYAKQSPITQRDVKGMLNFMKENSVPSMYKLAKENQLQFIVESQATQIMVEGRPVSQVFAWLNKEEDFLSGPTETKKGYLFTPAGQPSVYVETVKKKVELEDALPRQQLWYAYTARTAYLNQLKARVNPPPPDYAEMRAYIKANTFPSVNSLIDDGKMLLSDPAVPHPYVACFSTPEEKTTVHRAIATNGNLTFIPDTVVDKVFPKK